MHVTVLYWLYCMCSLEHGRQRCFLLCDFAMRNKIQNDRAIIRRAVKCSLQSIANYYRVF